MRILLTADIHNIPEWLRYLEGVAPEFELITIAGDVLDAEDDRGTISQVRDFYNFVPRVCASGTSLAITTGNHDRLIYGEDQIDDSFSGMWEVLMSNNWWDRLDQITVSGKVIAPGQAGVVTSSAGETIVVSAHPYRTFSAPNDATLWRQAAMLRKKLRCRWLALHHVPPVATLVGELNGSDDCLLNEHLDRWRPDFLASGHIHRRPFDTSGNWHDVFEGVHCFNPGCSRSPVPNFVILDTIDDVAEWRAKHDTGGKPRISDIRKLSGR